MKLDIIYKDITIDEAVAIVGIVQKNLGKAPNVTTRELPAVEGADKPAPQKTEMKSAPKKVKEEPPAAAEEFDFLNESEPQEEKPVKYEDVVAALKDFNIRAGAENTKKLMAKKGLKSAKELKPEQFKDFVEFVKKAAEKFPSPKVESNDDSE